MEPEIFIINFGSQYTHLLCKCIRKLNVYAEIINPRESFDIIKKCTNKPKGIILGGGPYSVYEPDSPQLDMDFIAYCIDNEIKILGICYGYQLLVQLLGGVVTVAKKSEYGLRKFQQTKESPLFTNLPQNHDVWMSHRDEVIELPKEYLTVCGKTSTTQICSVQNENLGLYGIQFHPEVEHSKFGLIILDKFTQICHCKRKWRINKLVDTFISNIRKKIVKSGTINTPQYDYVLMAVSGGIDSTVVAQLMRNAIGNKLICVYIDHGMMRQGETEEVCEFFSNISEFYCIKTQKFIERLEGIEHPEEKRQIIGHTFIDVFQDFTKQIVDKYDIKWLAQGTIYPDRIESGVNGSDTIKSHHNLMIPDDLELSIIEPLRNLYKDEVRTLGILLNIPKKIIHRQPFPGPGLAIRIVGEVTPIKLDTDTEMLR